MRNALQRCFEGLDLLPSVVMIVALTAFLLLAMTALVFYAIPRMHHVPSSPVVVTQEPSPYHAIVSPTAAPSFDFYTLLPKAPVAVNKDTQTKSSAAHSVPQYALQLAAVSSMDDAQRVSDRLALLGYQTMIVPVSQNNQSWYRVFTGPYATLAAAKSDQKKLKKKQITSFSVQLSSGSVTNP